MSTPPEAGTGRAVGSRTALAAAPPAAGATGHRAGAPAGTWAAARFVAAATAALAAAGLLVQVGLLPWVEPGLDSGLLGFYDSLSPSARTAFAGWQATGVLVSVVLPSLALLAWGRRDRDVHRVLAPYLLVLLVQVGVEAVLAQVFFPNIVVLTGLLYTGYRLRQLRHSRAAMAAPHVPGRSHRRVVRVLLTAGLAFWTTNLAFLLTVALPAITRLP